MVKALVAVWLGLIGPYVFQLLKFPFVRGLQFLERWDRGATTGVDEALLATPQPSYCSTTSAAQDSPRTDERPETQDKTMTPHSASALLKQSSGGRDLCIKTVTYALDGRNRHKLTLALVGLVVFGSFVARTFVGVLSALIATNSSAIWASEKCGLYRFNSDGIGEEAAARADVYDRAKEARAGEYAKYCYNSTSPATLPMRCGFFYETEIKFSTTYQDECPFPKDDICAHGSQAVTFDTGLVGANSIGINDPYGYKFRRSATCIPLSTEGQYVRNDTANRTAAFTYHYGETGNRDYTFRSVGDPFNWLVPGYDVRSVQTTSPTSESCPSLINFKLLNPQLTLFFSVQSTSWYPNISNWTPIPALNPPPNTILTIMFISPLHLLYLKASTDPIFLADTPFYYPDDPTPIYYKNDAKYRVLACLDSHELCPPSGPCHSMIDSNTLIKSTTQDTLPPPQYFLMKWALEFSNIYHSIAKRLGTALVAQDMISQYTSVPLGDEHWVDEAERLFATSLARIQFDVWSIGSGEDSVHEGKDGYRDEKPKGIGELCGLVKFQSTGFTNVGVLVFWLVLGVLPFAWVLSWEVDSVVWVWKWVVGKVRGKGVEEGGDGEDVKTLVFYLLLWALSWICCNPVRAVNWLGVEVQHAWGKLRACFVSQD